MTLTSTPSTSSNPSQSGGSSPAPKPGSSLPQSPILKPQSNISISANITIPDGSCLSIKEVDTSLFPEEEYNCSLNDERIQTIDLDLLNSVENNMMIAGDTSCNTDKPARKKQKLQDYSLRFPPLDFELSPSLPSSLSVLPSDNITITVSTLMGNVFIIDDISQDDSLDVLKMNIFEVSGVIPENQILLLHDKPLPTVFSTCSIKSLGIVNNSSIKLILSMTGGPGSFMIDSVPYKKQQEYLDDEFYFSSSSFSNSFNVDEFFDNDSDDTLFDYADDFTTASESLVEQPFHAQTPTPTPTTSISASLPSKAFIYRAESGNIFIVELSGAYADISLLTLIKNEYPNHIKPPQPSESVDMTLESQQISSSSSSLKLDSTCFLCNKRIRQSLRYPCKCSNLFCLSHKPPHLHDCSYNYCDANKKDLINSYPPIISSTLRNSQ